MSEPVAPQQPQQQILTAEECLNGIKFIRHHQPWFELPTVHSQAKKVLDYIEMFMNIYIKTENEKAAAAPAPVAPIVESAAVQDVLPVEAAAPVVEAVPS